jgi:hypothetical protein
VWLESPSTVLFECSLSVSLFQVLGRRTASKWCFHREEGDDLAVQTLGAGPWGPGAELEALQRRSGTERHAAVVRCQGYSDDRTSFLIALLQSAVPDSRSSVQPNPLFSISSGKKATLPPRSSNPPSLAGSPQAKDHRPCPAVAPAPPLGTPPRPSPPPAGAAQWRTPSQQPLSGPLARSKGGSASTSARAQGRVPRPR